MALQLRSSAFQIEIIPPTSIAIPLIVKYLTFTMFMVSLSVIFTVIVSPSTAKSSAYLSVNLSIATQQVQNVHFRTAEFPMSEWVRSILIDKIGRKLLISRATEKANFHRKAQHNKVLHLSK